MTSCKKLAAIGAAAMILPAAAEASIFTDRTAFETELGSFTVEDFESCGNATASLAGPLDSANAACAITSDFTVSSQSNDLFIGGPGQSTNPTTAIGSNTPVTDSLFIEFGATLTAFGIDLFQNDGFGQQFAGPIDVSINFYLGGALNLFVFGYTASVMPDGGSFFGFTGLPEFDAVQIFSQASSYEVIDNVTYASAASVVPVPAALPLMLTGLAGFGFLKRRRKTA